MEDMNNKLDLAESKNETYKHKQTVSKFINIMIHKLIDRSLNHDNSKLEEPEASTFAEYTKKLEDTTYGSDEYKEYLSKMKLTLNMNHYPKNKHHPEYYSHGIQNMDLVDILEMLCDWKAATLRHKDGDIYQSIEINQKRFGYSNELKQIFKNTIDNYFV